MVNFHCQALSRTVAVAPASLILMTVADSQESVALTGRPAHLRGLVGDRFSATMSLCATLPDLSPWCCLSALGTVTCLTRVIAMIIQAKSRFVEYRSALPRFDVASTNQTQTAVSVVLYYWVAPVLPKTTLSSQSGSNDNARTRLEAEVLLQCCHMLRPCASVQCRGRCCGRCLAAAHAVS